MAPEQRSGGRVDGRADLFALLASGQVLAFASSGFFTISKLLWLWICSNGLLSLTLLMLSLHFFRRGEVYLSKRRSANCLLVVVMLITSPFTDWSGDPQSTP